MEIIHESCTSCADKVTCLLFHLITFLHLSLLLPLLVNLMPSLKIDFYCASMHNTNESLVEVQYNLIYELLLSKLGF